MRFTAIVVLAALATGCSSDTSFVVAILAGLALAGRYDGRLAHSFQWFVFGSNALVPAGAALYFTFVRFDHMI